MGSSLFLSDWIIFICYFLLVAGYGLWVYRRKTKASVSATNDYFLAEGSLTWWAIGASLIGSNISAEQFIGMSGDGFSSGIAVGAYEWVAAICLIIVAVWFIPIYLKNKIYTMPQFLKERYNETVAVIMAVFWLFLYVFVNLTSILFLGALAISGLVGQEYFHAILLILAFFSIFIALGGMKVIGYTSVIQVVVLIVGGFIATWVSLTKVDEVVNQGSSAFGGFFTLMREVPDHFKLIFDKPTTSSSVEYISKYLALPGLTMYFAGQWVANLNYWGCNQYITQRALGADLKTARHGILFAGILKLFTPIIVMLPGIAAYVLVQKGYFSFEMLGGKKDGAYAAVLSLLPTGIKGISVAALTAAIVASLAGKVNSISTIFTLDIYHKYFNAKASEKHLVRVGQVAILVALAIAILCCWEDLLGIKKGGFTFIQKYTGYVSPAVFSLFLLGFFRKRTNGTAAIVGLLFGVFITYFFDRLAPGLMGNETWIYTAYPNESGVYEIPFMVNMGWSFVFTVALMEIISRATPKAKTKEIIIDKSLFKLGKTSIALITIILMVIVAIYAKFW